MPNAVFHRFFRLMSLPCTPKVSNKVFNYLCNESTFVKLNIHNAPLSGKSQSEKATTKVIPNLGVRFRGLNSLSLLCFANHKWIPKWLLRVRININFYPDPEILGTPMALMTNTSKSLLNYITLSIHECHLVCSHFVDYFCREYFAHVFGFSLQLMH